MSVSCEGITFGDKDKAMWTATRSLNSSILRQTIGSRACVERLERAFVVNGLDDDKATERRAVNLQKENIRTVENALCAEQPANKPFKDLCALLESHCCPNHPWSWNVSLLK